MNDLMTQEEAESALNQLQEEKGISREETMQIFEGLKEVTIKGQENFGKVLDTVNQHIVTQGEVEKCHTRATVEITKITKKYKLMREIFGTLFSQRQKVLDKEFEIIDKGIAENSYATIYMGMKSLSDIVAKSPFSDFKSFSDFLDSDTGTLEF